MKTWQKITVWILFVALPLGIMATKMLFLDYTVDQVIPWRAYRVLLDMTLDGHGDSVDVATFLPSADRRQHVWEEAVLAEGLSREAFRDSSGNRVIRLSAATLSDRNRIRVEYRILGERLRYAIEDGLALEITRDTREHLDSTPKIQARHEEIAALLNRLVPRRDRALPVLQAVFSYVTDSVVYRNFTGSTDALTTFRLGEASCNGKSRLMAALLRTAGIPTRLVGGLILEKGEKKTSHQWVEAQLAGHWIPFCPTNRHFAEIPQTYLTLYRGDEYLFRHTANINFNYSFDITPILVGKEEIGLGKDQLGGIMDIWDVFSRAGLSLAILKALLLMPIGGLVTVLFRNVIGLEPFGTFLPALIALAARETGLAWGMASFFLVIGICSLLRALLEGLKLTHTPKLAIIMVFVVASMLGLTYLGLTLGMPQLVYVSLFPIVVQTMTVERFSRSVVEEGLTSALRRAAVTAAAIPCCYVLMSSKALALFLMAFPEALLLAAALNIWIGRWAGIRVMEYWRFRHFLFRGEEGIFHPPAGDPLSPTGKGA